jgi:RNA-directed DNA polymerase
MPSRRVYIEKEDGRQRPFAIPALEDKLVQQAVVTILNQIYEEDFLGFSYGFRPGRSQHQALDALSYALLKKKVNYVLDADIRGFFDNLDKSWLIKFVEHRVADPRVLRLIQKWLNAGVMEELLGLLEYCRRDLIAPADPLDNPRGIRLSFGAAVTLSIELLNNLHIEQGLG